MNQETEKIKGQPEERHQEEPAGVEGMAPAPGPENTVNEMNEQLEAKQKELEEALQRYLRLAADFDNFRRRTRQELDDVRKTAAERLIGELLPVLDNFERALASARSLFPDSVVTGIDMIYRQLWHVLEQSGAQPMDAAGQTFDPTRHEAFEQVETDDFPEGTVIEEVQKGYLLNGKVLRPALVRVAKRPSLDEFAEV